MVFDAVREALRQESAADSKFLQSLIYYFELRVPAAASSAVSKRGKVTNFIFPLVLAPDQISIEEPFTLAETKTQGSGLYVERNGIIGRTIKLRGTTGFKPRAFRGDAFHLIQPNDEKKGHNRSALSTSMARAAPGIEFSGQKQFQFLQDVFRLYSDLVQNPKYALETQLLWHNPKDDEHWMVEPRRFGSDRQAGSSRVTYPYDIELLAYAPAADAEASFSEEKDLLDQIKDGIQMVNSAVQLARGAINDVTGLVNEIEGLVNGVANTISNITGIIDDAANLVNGVAELITSPIDAVTSVTTSLAQNLENLGQSTTAVPDAVFQSLRQMEDAMDRLAQFPAYFQTSTQAALQKINRVAELSTSNSRAELEAAAARNPPNSFQALLALGTANTPGDLQTASSELGLSRSSPRYQSAREHVVASGDTLPSLAARFLGDAREWRILAILNELSAPYFSDTGIPGTVTVGSKILIPSTTPPPSNRTLTPVLGVDSTRSTEDRLLGTDFQMVRTGDPNNTVDFEVDVAGGSVDFKMVSGVENLTQACLTRLETEKGTNQLFQNVGVNPIVATGNVALDKEIGLFHIAQAVLEDPRIVSVENLKVRPSSSDSLVVDLDAVPVNFSESVSLNLEVA